MWWVILIFILILATLVYLDTRKPYNFPPGPRWWPIIGCLPEFTKLRRKHELRLFVWSEIAEKYGPIVGLRIGRGKTVLVSGKDAITEGLSREEFDARQDDFFARVRTDGERREQRRFALSHLRDFGFGKKSMEAMIREEALEMATRLAEKGKIAGDEVVDAEKMYTIPVLNSLWAMIVGERYSHDDKILLKLIKVVGDASRSLASTDGWVSLYPILRFFFPGFKRYNEVRKRLWKYFSDTVEDHEKTIVDGQPRDLIDIYIQEMKRRKGEDSSFSKTTSNTLDFATLYLLHHPDVQAKIHEEIDRVVGRDRTPTLEDKPNLPYLNASIDFVTLPILHCLTVARRKQNSEGCMLMFNLRSIHMDRDHWGDPEVFRPERFLVPGENGGPMKLKDENWVVPFGIGRRRCLGEPLARTSLFIFFSIILHRLRFSNPPGLQLPSTQGINSTILRTGPFKAVVQPRF
ncbi:hypothetical protein J437_LFUL004618 [Ladona fulva]|uniref:Cytochrome P450 n=1 Tax=Ladona fulva TaxID=123851 RepID=A0A8K0K3P7_LADFU|nr:hypothetical protein J437_LFUL004618 [Ladona fulva]